MHGKSRLESTRGVECRRLAQAEIAKLPPNM